MNASESEKVQADTSSSKGYVASEGDERHRVKGAQEFPSDVLKDKEGRILECCGASPDRHKLASFATSRHGLVNDDVRQIACRSPSIRTVCSLSILTLDRAHTAGYK